MKNTLFLFALIFSFFYKNDLPAQVTGSFMHDGVLRTYRLFLPSDYQSYEALPLVFNLHGRESDGIQQEFYSAMNQVADTAKFFVCYPTGFNNGSGNEWNVGWTFGSDKDDVGFINRLIDTISANYNVDTEAVFSCGMSNGGFLSYKLACELNDRIKAIASVTGAMVASEVQNCTPDIPVPVMQIHGTADDVVLYNGSPLINIPIEDLVNNWVGINSCNSPGDTIPVPDIVPSDGTTSERIEYNDCDSDSRVVFYKVTGGGHTWPGAPISIPILGPTSQDFKASHEIWLFFKPYTSPLTSAVEEPKAVANVIAFPNPFDDFIRVDSQKGVLKSLRIYNAIGQVVFYQPAIHSADFQIPASDFQSGLYFINVETTEGVAVLKTVKP